MPQRVEVAGAAGQHLVDVGLVAGVEDDPVPRGVEDPVHRERQLDHAEVGAEVAAPRGAGRDEELSRISAASDDSCSSSRSRSTRGPVIDAS